MFTHTASQELKTEFHVNINYDLTHEIKETFILLTRANTILCERSAGNSADRPTCSFGRLLQMTARRRASACVLKKGEKNETWQAKEK